MSETYFIATSLFSASIRLSTVLSLSFVTAEDWFLSPEIKLSHCSENLTRLIKAEKIERVRSGSGNARSFALKSTILAARANRCLSMYVRRQSHSIFIEALLTDA